MLLGYNFKNKVQMKLTLETYGKKYTIETQHEDVSLEEYFDFFKGILVASSWSEDSVQEYIIELAEELKELRNGRHNQM